MIAITHFIVCLLLIELMQLDRNDAFIGLAFGFFIDLDHLFGLKDYVQANGFRAVFDFQDMVNPGGHWKSLMHTPIAAMIVGPVSIASRLAVPLVFWSAHLAMDFVQENFLVVLSLQESMFLVLLGAALFTIRYARSIVSGKASTVSQYLRLELEGLRRIRGRSVFQ